KLFKIAEDPMRLPHAACSSDYAPSDYHLFRSISHRLSEQRFQSFEDVEKWVKKWIESDEEAFYHCGVRLLPERWGKILANDGQYNFD
ncbi:hypothetical protein ANCDUO_10483, partial [Ancylostoma duodenale]